MQKFPDLRYVCLCIQILKKASHAVDNCQNVVNALYWPGWIQSYEDNE